MKKTEREKNAETLFKELGKWMLKKNEDGFTTFEIGDALLNQAASEMAFQCMQSVTHGGHKTWELAKASAMASLSVLMEGVRKQLNDEFTGFDTLHDQDF